MPHASVVAMRYPRVLQYDLDRPCTTHMKLNACCVVDFNTVRPSQALLPILLPLLEVLGLQARLPRYCPVLLPAQMALRQLVEACYRVFECLLIDCVSPESFAVGRLLTVVAESRGCDGLRRRSQVYKAELF